MDKIVQNNRKRITKKYSKDHLGLDLNWSTNNYVTAHSFGVVEQVVDGKNNKKGSTGIESYGNFVFINHQNGYKTRYAHLEKQSIKVRIGDIVNENTVIGIIGNSGNAYGKHLHFEVHKNNTRINPEPFLNKEFTNNIYYQIHNKNGWSKNRSINEVGEITRIAIDGIYLDKYKMRVHDKIKKKWLPWVENRNDYAGNLGNPIDGVQIYGVTYRVHLKNKEWLPWIYKVDNTNNGYAGIYNNEIDGLQIKKL